MNVLQVESRRHVVALSWIAVEVGLYHVAVSTHLLDHVLELKFIRGQAAITCD